MTLAEIRQMIRATLPAEVTDVTDSYLTVMVNQGVYEISMADQWPFLEATDTITFVADTQNYDLPADFEFGLALIDDDNDNTLMELSPQAFFHQYGNDTDNESTHPVHFMVYDNDIYISPIPSEADTNRLTLKYYKSPTELSADGDAPAFADAFHWMLVDWVASKLARREGLSDVAQFHMVEFERRLSEMKRYYSRRFVSSRPIYGDGIVGGFRGRSNFYRNLTGFMW